MMNVHAIVFFTYAKTSTTWSIVNRDCGLIFVLKMNVNFFFNH